MINLPEDVKKVMRETYNQQLTKPIAAIELPCTKYHKWKQPQYVQLNEARDQKVLCPLCGREHYLVWSKIQNHKFS